LNYPSVCIDADGTVYAGAVYSGQFRVNVFRGAAMVYPAGELPPLGPANLLDRCPPRLIRGPDGAVWAFWRQGTRIMAGAVKSLLAGGEAANTGISGDFPAVAWDGSAFRLVVVADGGLKTQTWKP
jgi:hypothetical protein